MKPKDKVSRVYSSLDRKRLAEEELIACNAEASRLAGVIPAVKNKLFDANQRVLSYEESVDNAREDGRRSEYSSFLDDAKRDVERLRTELARLESQAIKVNEERSRLRAEIDALGSGVDATILVAHQKSVLAARVKVDDLKSLISTKEEELKSASVDSDEQFEGLQRRREDVLAAVATGEATQDAIAAIDGEIATLLADTDGQEGARLQQYRELSQTLSGLERKLKEAVDTLAQLEADTPEMLTSFLRTEAEDAGRAYIESARVVIENFQRLHTLNTLITSRGQSSPISVKAFPDMRLPAFVLDCFSSVSAHDAAQGVFYSSHAALAEGQFNTSRSDELQRLREMGLQEIFGW